MIITKDKILKIGFYGLWTYYICLLVKFSWIPLIILMVWSFLHDILGILKPVKTYKAEWSDFGATFIGFFVGALTYDMIKLGKLYFLIPIIVYAILTFFAFLNYYRYDKR